MRVNTFKELNLSPGVMAAVEELGFTDLTPVQAACIPVFLGNRKDVSVEAITGSGKTLAFLIPVLEKWQKMGSRKKENVFAVIISPTRELAAQIAEVTDLFLRHISGITSVLLIGGQALPIDLMNMKEYGMNIIISTPGRLEDILENRKDFKLPAYLKSLEMLILDEADKLLDMGFETTLNNILSYLPKQRQTGLFSATQTKLVEDLVRAGLQNPTCISVKEKGVDDNSNNRTPSTLSNYYMVCEADKKLSILLWFLTSKQEGKYLVFFSNCASVDYFAMILKSLLKQYKVLSLHGRMRKERSKIFSAFKNNDNAILLCSDVMARGIDIADISWVIQYDPPSSASSFVHRCGRTARIGNTGNALLMVLPNEESFVDFLEINQKVILDRIEAPEVVEDITPTVRNMALQNRSIFEKGMKAFVSHIRFYTKHDCELLFRIKDLNFGKLANGFALIKLPIMEEMKKIDVSDFIASDVNFDDIPYLDKEREKQRLLELKTDKRKRKPKRKKETDKEKQPKAKRVKKKKKKEKKVEFFKWRKRSHQVDLNWLEWEEYDRDAQMLRKLKVRKINEKQFLDAVCPGEF